MEDKMEEVLRLCNDLPIREISAGEALMSQGGTRIEMAVLKKGKVEITMDGQQLSTIDRPGAIFGEMSVILQCPHTATVRALEDSTFYLIEDPSAFLWERAEFNFELLKLLARRLERINKRLADQKHRAETERVAYDMIGEMIEDVVHHHDPSSAH